MTCFWPLLLLRCLRCRLAQVSNERIPLSDSMRLIFEIESLANATPATVSRAGILYINKEDVGWLPYVERWVSLRTDAAEKALLPGLFEKYVNPAFQMLQDHGLKHAVPVSELGAVQCICSLAGALLDEHASAAAEDPSEADVDKLQLLEQYFVFAVIWAMGGALAMDKANDLREMFSEAWVQTFKKVKFPNKGQIFDYMFSLETGELQLWDDMVPQYVPMGEHISEIIVPTADSQRVTFLVDMLVRRQKPVLLVGVAGTGKTTVLREYMETLDNMAIQAATVNCNYYTDAMAMQRQMESVVDKRSGKIYGPPAGKRVLYFIDDHKTA